MGRLIATAVAIVMAALVFGASPASAQDGDAPLNVTVTLDGQPITGRTVELDPSRVAELSITAENPGTKPQKVRLIRVSGVALALTFYAYDTTLPFEVPARGRITRAFPLDVRDLDGQAAGLLPTSVKLLDEDRNVLGAADTVADVKGSYWSVYGVFGLALLAFTIFLWISALLALARHKLSPNRFRRALRFLPAGIGTGLVAVVSLSVLRMVPPEVAVEIPIVLGAAVIAMVLGFLTPHPVPNAPAAELTVAADGGTTVAMTIPAPVTATATFPTAPDAFPTAPAAFPTEPTFPVTPTPAEPSPSFPTPAADTDGGATVALPYPTEGQSVGLNQLLDGPESQR